MVHFYTYISQPKQSALEEETRQTVLGNNSVPLTLGTTVPPVRTINPSGERMFHWLDIRKCERKTAVESNILWNAWANLPNLWRKGTSNQYLN